jgi:hypothetical protein
MGRLLKIFTTAVCFRVSDTIPQEINDRHFDMWNEIATNISKFEFNSSDSYESKRDILVTLTKNDLQVFTLFMSRSDIIQGFVNLLKMYCQISKDHEEEKPSLGTIYICFDIDITDEKI